MNRAAPTPVPALPASGAAPRVILADDWLLVVEKPAGLLAVPGRGADKADCLSARLQALHPEALIVHRLDEATSGLMLFARHPEAQRRLSRAFERRRVAKRYVAVVDGRPAAARGRIELPLAADWPRRPLQRVDAEHGRPSRSDWMRMRQGGVDAASCRLALVPHTGRSHQLRVHLAAIGHPILGDALYAPPAVLARAPRLLLHASRLRLPHPADDGRRLDCSSPVPF
jgi:tRNA pseudouridine32 synthase/23S rRNA pseudouridine746 synthase